MSENVTQFLKPKKAARVSMTPKLRASILGEWNHRCAICGKDRPQIHHIDEDPSNNSPENLLPMCPNHHLSDQHNPTTKHQPSKLGVFREYKDPAILKPEFEPIFRRLEFLLSVPETLGRADGGEAAEDLVDFIRQFEMGKYYSQRLWKLLEPPAAPRVRMLGDPYDPATELEEKKQLAQEDLDYRSQLDNVRDDVIALVIEQLRFQRWPSHDKS
jgi:hypothetical protein